MRPPVLGTSFAILTRLFVTSADVLIFLTASSVSVLTDNEYPIKAIPYDCNCLPNLLMSCSPNTFCIQPPDLGRTLIMLASASVAVTTGLSFLPSMFLVLLAKPASPSPNSGSC